MFAVTKRTLCLVFIGVFTLAGCGGGNNSLVKTPAPTPTPNPTPTPPTSITLITQNNITQGQAVGLAALIPDSQTYNSLEWQQISGPAVTLLASNSQTVSFDAVQAGQYQFAFVLHTNNGDISKTIDVNVAASSAPSAQLRADHTAFYQEVDTSQFDQRTESLRVDGSQTVQSVSWQQIKGPIATLNKQGQELFFTVPKITFDTLLEFKATVTFTDGSQASDTAFVVAKHANINSKAIFPDADGQVVSEDVHPYIANGPYASKLVDCVYSNTRVTPCTFSTLPVIGQEHPNPTIDDILNRVVVSHNWMGDRFKQFLQQSATSQDIMNLLRATTAIVISYDVRPSFYWSATGAIYLDGKNFWMTPAERDTLNDAPDYRSAYGNDLQFDMYWYYLKNGQSAFGSYDPAQRKTRTFNHLEADAAYLMYHELAHANDFIPSTSWSTLDPASSSYLEYQKNGTTSDTMAQMFPLASDELTALAQVSFNGTTATAQQKTIQPNEVTAQFKDDNATDYYNYSTIREDLAMFFQHMMVTYRLGYTPAVAVVDNNDIVDWGQFNRIASAYLQDKERFILNHILPDVNADSVLAAQQPVAQMKTGVSFSDSLFAGQQAKGGHHQIDRKILLRLRQQETNAGRPAPLELKR